MRRRLLIVAAVILTMVFTTTFAAAETQTVSRFTGKTYTHSSWNDGKIIAHGIDVSAWQDNVDWSKVKASGVDYAIIRIGYRGSSEGAMNPDKDFVEHIEGAKAAGLMVGVYFFSQAINELEAVAEAKYTLELLGDYELDLPIFMDYEFSGGSSGRLNKANLSKSKATSIARKFCETIEEAGHPAGVYANRNFLLDTVNGNQLAQDYIIWLAQYYTMTTYDYDYQIWQYSSDGKIDGIPGRCDVNFMYMDMASSVDPTDADAAYSMAGADVMLMGQTVYNYSPGESRKPAVTVLHSGMPLIEGVDYTVKYINNIHAGTAHAVVLGKGAYHGYKMVPFTIDPIPGSGKVTVTGIKDSVYNGKEQKPSSVTVTDHRGQKLYEGLDYTFTGSSAINAGKAKVELQFIGDYTGSQTLTYNITKGQQAITVKNPLTSATVETLPHDLGVSLKFADGKVSYASSNEAVAKISDTGVVTIAGGGKTTLTIKAAGTSNYEGAVASIDLKVLGQAQNVTTQYTRYKRTEDRIGSSFSLKAATDGDGALTYTSSDEAVATVSEEGRVTVQGVGTAEITVTAAETDKFAAGQKVVTLTVTEVVEHPQQNIIDGVKDTTIKLSSQLTSKGKVKLTWKKSAGYKLDYYEVYRSLKRSSGYGTKPYFTSSNAKDCYYINSKGLKKGTKYYYKVRGVRVLDDGTKAYTEYSNKSWRTVR